APVVHPDGVSHHVRVNRRAARPGAHQLLVIRLVHRLDLHHQVRVDERALLGGTCHLCLLLATTTDDECIGTLVVACLIATRRLAPWRHRMTAAGGLAFAAAVRV